MNKFLISGGKPLKGEVTVGGAKNVAMKVIVAGLLTDEPIAIKNAPLISSVLGTTKIVTPLGVKVERRDHTLHISGKGIHSHTIPLELGGQYRTATMVMGPLLARFGKAVVPNPGGCRLGKRPVDWHVAALTKMGAIITYKDGYFYAEAKKLSGAHITFAKNTHTGTETLILAAVLADGETIIENAAEEPEVDDLIALLLKMGAVIRREGRRLIIKGVKKLHGAEHAIMPDRNEAVTYAVAAIATKGDITVTNTQRPYLESFLAALDDAEAGWEPVDEHATRFYFKKGLEATHLTTRPHPGFMTDWQQPWAVLMTQAKGVSTIHESVFESRFSYVGELKKMGAKIDFYNPTVDNPHTFYNFNWNDRIEGYSQGIRIYGPTLLHDAVVEMTDLRAGATLIVAALTAQGKSVIKGIDHVDRGYEKIDEQLTNLGADIKREEDTT